MNVAKDTALFEQAVRFVWPWMRVLCRHRLTPRCRQCTLSSKAPGVTLEGGICNYCRESKTKQESPVSRAGDQELQEQRRLLDELLRSSAGSGRGRYDALLLLSGGKDSTYLLHLLRKDYSGLRLLCVTMDNGFYSDVAIENARKVAAKLGVEHILYQPRVEIFRNLYRWGLTHIGSGRGGSYVTVDFLNGSFQHHIGMHLSAQCGVPLLITGLSWSQVVLSADTPTFEVSRELLCGRRELARIEEKLNVPLNTLFDADAMRLWWDGSGFPQEKIPRCISPFAVWRPSTQQIVQELLGAGLLTREQTNPLRTNTPLIALMAAVDMAQLGYCSFEPDLATLVRYGQEDAVYWRNVFELLEYAVKTKRFIRRPHAETLARLGLTPKDVGL